jgi:hypothetical protein
MKTLKFKFESSIPTLGKNADLNALFVSKKMMQTKQAIQNKLIERFRKERISTGALPVESKQLENGWSERTSANPQCS